MERNLEMVVKGCIRMRKFWIKLKDLVANVYDAFFAEDEQLIEKSEDVIQCKFLWQPGLMSDLTKFVNDNIVLGFSINKRTDILRIKKPAIKIMGKIVIVGVGDAGRNVLKKLRDEGLEDIGMMSLGAFLDDGEDIHHHNLITMNGHCGLVAFSEPHWI